MTTLWQDETMLQEIMREGRQEFKLCNLHVCVPAWVIGTFWSRRETTVRNKNGGRESVGVGSVCGFMIGRPTREVINLPRKIKSSIH